MDITEKEITNFLGQAVNRKEESIYGPTTLQTFKY